MDKFWVVTLFHFQPSLEERLSIEERAMEMDALGIEEFSLSEPEVDEILGERSYSGGDLPQEVLDEVEETVLGRPTNYRFFFDNKSMAENFLQGIKSQALCEAQIEECEAEDWNAEWKKHYNPIKVNDELTIIPSWLKDYKSDSKKEILIYPGMGFGTGSHETTFLCLKLFTEDCLNKKIENVLDFGSGSGILGLATFKFLNDVRVDFYDIDPEANKNCFQNAELNDLEERPFRLLLPEVRNKLQASYDLVFANILESILLEEKGAITALVKTGGTLILSGLLRHQSANIISNYSQNGFVLKRSLEKGDWSALLFEKV